MWLSTILYLLAMSATIFSLTVDGMRPVTISLDSLAQDKQCQKLH